MNRLGAIAVGRNEGERLRRCLMSLVREGAPAVYVDSGSSDGSLELARSLGVDVVELDPSRPFRVARARSAGYERLLALHPHLEYAMFVDGDCEVAAGWLQTAQQTLDARAELAIVCGRRRERQPEASLYNRLCDLEWDTPVGDALACGGDAVVRCSAFQKAGGYNPEVIVGEEAEMCLRVRRDGWKIERLPAEMTLHDAGMTRLGQWWRRAIRAGYGYAEGRRRHGRSDQRHRIKETRSIWCWGLIFPLTALALAWPTSGWSLLGFLAYPLQALRVAVGRHARQRIPWRDALLYGGFSVLAKFPQLWGQLRFLWTAFARRQGPLIEYK